MNVIAADWPPKNYLTGRISPIHNKDLCKVLEPMCLREDSSSSPVFGRIKGSFHSEIPMVSPLKLLKHVLHPSKFKIS